MSNEVMKLTNHNEDPKKTLVRTTLRAITGLKDIMPEKAIEVFNIFNFYDYEVCEESSKLAIDRYDDPFNKYPSKTFWRTCVSDVMRSRRLRGLDKPNESCKPSDEERQKVAQKAREMREYFANINGQELEAPKNNYELKVERYKGNAKLGNVLIRGGALDGTWISKEEAIRDNHSFICPIEWLANKEKPTRINNM